MRRVITVLGLVAVLVPSCVGSDKRSKPRDATMTVEVVRSGSAVADGRVGAAALLKVRGSDAVGPVELKLSFLDERAKVVAATDESLPFCGGDSSCWWAGYFGLDQFGVSGSSIRRVRVAVSGSSKFIGDVRIEPFEVSRDERGAIRGSAPGDQGSGYVVAFQDGSPRWGGSFTVVPQDRAAVVIPPDLLPPLENERLRGYFYSGPVPTGH